MTYKSVLVHAADESRWSRVLDVAITVARRFEAHLTALCVMPPEILDPALTPGGAATVIDRHRKAFETSEARMKGAFEERSRTAMIGAEWRTDDARRASGWERLIEHGRSADLIIASQRDPHWPLAHLLESPADLVLKSGRPVLFVPATGHHAEFGNRAVVAWNGSREAARAAFDAVPLLRDADKVSVLWVNAEKDKAAQDLPAADLCTALARHGVRAEAGTIAHADDRAGDVLLERARQTNASLLVMGGYGHSRLRELVLGGATRHVLQHMSVPVLMSH